MKKVLLLILILLVNFKTVKTANIFGDGGLIEQIEGPYGIKDTKDKIVESIESKQFELAKKYLSGIKKQLSSLLRYVAYDINKSTPLRAYLSTIEIDFPGFRDWEPYPKDKVFLDEKEKENAFQYLQGSVKKMLDFLNGINQQIDDKLKKAEQPEEPKKTEVDEKPKPQEPKKTEADKKNILSEKEKNEFIARLKILAEADTLIPKNTAMRANKYLLENQKSALFETMQDTLKEINNDANADTIRKKMNLINKLAKDLNNVQTKKVKDSVMREESVQLVQVFNKEFSKI